MSTIYRDNMEKAGKQWSVEEETEFKAPISKWRAFMCFYFVFCFV
jgi:hypothetical protein